jgi:N utilization substance protein A
LNEALAAEEEIEEHKPTAELLDMPGMTESIAYALAGRGVSTPDDLAELAADEISDIEEMGMEKASALILTARAAEIARLEQSN